MELGQVLYLGRAPRTKETLPDFREWCRVTRHPRVFRGLTGCQRTPREWGVTRGALPKVQTCPNKFTMTIQGPYASKIMATWAPASILTNISQPNILHGSRVFTLLLIQHILKLQHSNTCYTKWIPKATTRLSSKRSL